MNGRCIRQMARQKPVGCGRDIGKRRSAPDLQFTRAAEKYDGNANSCLDSRSTQQPRYPIEDVKRP
jgi:hypothetical protein